MKRKFKLILLIILNLLAGTALLLQPEKTPIIIIRIIGLTWFFEGLTYITTLSLEILKNKINDRNTS